MTKKNDNLKSDILKLLHKKLFNQLLIGLAILAGITGLSLWGIKVAVEQIAINRISKQFEEPRIQELLKDVAENQAKEIIKNRLNPAIQKAISTVNKKIDSFETDLQVFKNTYDKEQKKLIKEVEYIKSRNMMLRLADKAIAKADSESFEELENIYMSTSDEDLKMIALSEMFRVKHHFGSMTRIKGIEMTVHTETGRSFKGNDIPTEALIRHLSEDKWRVRARVVELLKGRKEKQVPEALLNAIQNDKNLEVRAKAMKSFENITGFESSDVFKYAPAEDWWDKNKKDINLKDLQTIQSVLEKNNDDENKN